MADETPLGRNLEFLISDVARLMTREYDRKVRDLNLTRSQWWVLVFLIRYDGHNQTELADVLDIGKVALGGLLDRLEAKGWVERRPDATDRRAKRVYLTEQVKPLIREKISLLRASYVTLLRKPIPCHYIIRHCVYVYRGESTQWKMICKKALFLSQV